MEGTYSNQTSSTSTPASLNHPFCAAMSHATQPGQSLYAILRGAPAFAACNPSSTKVRAPRNFKTPKNCSRIRCMVESGMDGSPGIEWHRGVQSAYQPEDGPKRPPSASWNGFLS